MAALVEIYTRPDAAIAALRNLLTRKNAAFTELTWRSIRTGGDGPARQRWATFPQIFIDKQHVGGCDDLYARLTAKANSMACSSGRSLPHDSQQRKRRAVHCGHGADAHRDVAGDTLDRASH
jgi:glutaredoxin 3